MIINGKEYAEILIKDKTGGLAAYITDEKMDCHNALVIELIPKEGENESC